MNEAVLHNNGPKVAIVTSKLIKKITKSFMAFIANFEQVHEYSS